MIHPKVSVVMSVYNTQRYLRAAVASILKQTFADFEFVVVDDGSTDQSSAILDSLAQQDARLKVIHNATNLGMAKSLNIGIKFSRGKYIARQDADDISEPNRLKTQVAFLDSHFDHGLVGTFINEIDADGKEIRKVYLPINWQLIQFLSPKRCCFVHGSVMLRKSLLKKVGYYEESLASKSGIQDFELWNRVVLATKTDNIDKFLYRLRKNPQGISNLHRMEQTRLQKSLEQKIARNLRRLHLPYKEVVSVVIPTYNRTHFLIKALKSVLSQTYSHLEIIVVDDGSQPSMGSLIKEFQKQDNRLIYLRQKHQDVIIARNAGLSRSHGQFIAFLDDDDIWHKDKIAKQLKKFRTSKVANLGLVYCHHYWIDESDNVLGELKINLKGNLFSNLFYGNRICGSASAVLIKSAVLDQVGHSDKSYTTGEDWQLWLRIAALFGIDYVSEKLLYIRKTPQRRSRGWWQVPLDRFRILWTALKLIIQYPRLKTVRIFKEYILALTYATKSVLVISLDLLLAIPVPIVWWLRPILKIRKKILIRRYHLDKKTAKSPK